MKFFYLAIGDELLRGESREGNGATLAVYLQQRGLTLSEVRVLADTPESIAEALGDLTREKGLVVMSGGLGPTPSPVEM